MKKNIIKITLAALLSVGLMQLQSCETLEVKVIDSPNALSPTSSDVNLFLNAIQIDFTNFIAGIEGDNFKGMSELGMEPVRMLHGFGPTYRELYSPGSYGVVWPTAYSSILADIRAMNLSTEENGLYTHLAISQVIEAYVMVTLVDYFGDVPYSEAIDPNNFNPSLDSSASIYDAAKALLGQAISNFNRDEISLPTQDLYYGGDEEKWIKAATTILLKINLQTRLINESESRTAINQLISSGNLILNSSDDFQFQYSTASTAPDSRHPFFEKNYSGTGPSSNFYMSNYYMNLLANNYTTLDPRIRYYFYRQVSDFSGADGNTKDCVQQDKPTYYSANDPFCTVANVNNYNGLWGRDHLDPDGIPPDSQFRTLVGVYPAGGPYDDDSFNNLSGSTAPSAGLQGAGINPILLSSYTNFMLAEAALTIGTNGDAMTYLEAGIRESITKTMAFGASLANGSETIPTNTDIDDYISNVLSEYMSGDNTAKLKVIVEQYFIALWGNGIEAYNTYRRTGQPSDIQPAVELAEPGVFIRSHFYPSLSTDSNSNVSQKDGVSNPVFWDNNPNGFVD